MRNRFDEQLSQLNTELITMGALCEEAISGAAKYLIDNDSALKEKVIDTDKQIDRKERDIENLCLRLILHQQPVATDLRLISAALKMISDMERIGDQASDIAEIVKFVNKTNLRENVHIGDMARATIKMVTDSIDSFVKRDMDIAQSVILHDDTVDNLFLKIKGELISAIKDGTGDAEALIDLLMIAKYFERIGDHAENIAEWVIYSITGKHAE
ncbi:MAG: phosphate signaling complex protein PhoU [Eubacteriales bacterium]|jgi:phosphate transport system protein|nr:phosphate signaling complex protein PhoU [Clostridia bacterium]MDY4213054.1 phosphate signaling complex protein PhoU [Eubacteriales bacterium]